MRCADESSINMRVIRDTLSFDFRRTFDTLVLRRVISLSIVTVEEQGVGKEPPRGQSERVWV